MKTIIFSNVRDEDHILEWIVHYLNLGVDHIHIYDHKSIIPVSEIAKNIPKNKLTIECIDEFKKNELISKSYENAFKNNYTWASYLDADEFLFLNKDNNIYDFLNKYINYDQVCINWLIFGNNYKDDHTNGTIIENYIRSSNKIHSYVKHFLNLKSVYTNNYIFNTNVHFCSLKDMSKTIYYDFTLFEGKEYWKIIQNRPFFKNYSSNIDAFFAHYADQSYDTYLKRKGRPRDDNGEYYKVISKEQINKHNNDIINTSLLLKYNKKNKKCILNVKNSNIVKDTPFVYVKISENTNIELLNLWIKHYKMLNIDFKIYYNNKNIYNKVNNNLKYYLTDIILENCLELTEYDFLFYYEKDNEDNMVLSYNIDTNFLYKNILIGKVFYVPIEDKKKYTTFEIPDFILYQHSDHTNYTIDGIKINEGNFITNNIVCLNMNISKVVDNNEYYENNILFEGNISKNNYIRYSDCLIVNKEKKYCIIFHPKCASSTITNQFVYYNNITIDDTHCISIEMPKYRFNSYLQNIETICFVRNPYDRFISNYLNKHIEKKDNFYLELPKYKKYLMVIKEDTISNLVQYIHKNNFFIDEHTDLYSNFYYHRYKNLKYDIFKIENGIEKILFNFLKKFHHDKEIKYNIENITNKNNKYTKIENIDFKNFNEIDWKNYLNNNNNKFPNYSDILDDELKDILYEIYKLDFEKFSYNKIYKYYENNKNNELYELFGIEKDFTIEKYRYYNPDLEKINDSECFMHYVNHGKKEGRIYKIVNLPNDFNANMYKYYNPDLEIMTDIECEKHYIKNGINEGRVYKLENIPENFDLCMYKYFNPDLYYMTDGECIKHFSLHGINEKRTWNDKYFDKNFFIKKYNYNKNDENIYLKYIKDIRQEKNEYFIKIVKKTIFDRNKKNIFLVNHSESIYGASIFVYYFYHILKKNYPEFNIILFEIKYNDIVIKKFNILSNDVIEYKDDPTLLYLYYNYLNPSAVIFNSCNITYTQVYKYISKNKLILFSHEAFKNYLLSKVTIPDLVVSKLIANDYFSFYNKTPLIQPPFFPDYVIQDIVLRSNEEITEEIKNDFGILDSTKINICMCGEIIDRKNYKLFIEIANKEPKYNFIWIGGNDNEIFNKYKNIYYISYTDNPYKYFNKIVDYFILFSETDPCPYVILENIILETNIITFKSNILTDHNNPIIKNFYFEYPEKITATTCLNAINMFINGKKSHVKTGNGLEYINKYFSSVQKITNLINNCLSSSD